MDTVQSYLLARYYIHDHIYSPAALAMYNGTVIERYEYDAYGNPTIYNSDFSQTRDSSLYYNPYLFTGREFDCLDEANLRIQYNRNRYYDYYTGRWLTQDPAGYQDGLNLYEYVNDSPLKVIDPLGMSWLPPFPPIQMPTICGTIDVIYISHTYSFTKSGRCPPEGAINNVVTGEVQKEINQSLPIHKQFGCDGCCCKISGSFPWADERKKTKTFCWNIVTHKSSPPDPDGGCKRLARIGPCTVNTTVNVVVQVSFCLGTCPK